MKHTKHLIALAVVAGLGMVSVEARKDKEELKKVSQEKPKKAVEIPEEEAFTKEQIAELEKTASDLLNSLPEDERKTVLEQAEELTQEITNELSKVAEDTEEDSDDSDDNDDDSSEEVTTEEGDNTTSDNDDKEAESAE